MHQRATSKPNVDVLEWVEVMADTTVPPHSTSTT